MDQGNYVDTSAFSGLANWWKNTMDRVNKIDPITNEPYKTQTVPKAKQENTNMSAFASPVVAEKPVTVPAKAPVSALVQDPNRVQVSIPVPNNKPTQPGPKEGMITGLSPKEVEHLVFLESGNKGYDAVNKNSGAYGKYQFIPSTAAEYAKRLNIKGDDWKTPENQDKMFQAFTYDNVEGLRDRGMPVNLFNVYGAHQQGVSGFTDIMNNKLTPKLERNMRANLPDSKGLKGQELRSAWINYWKDRTTM